MGRLLALYFLSGAGAVAVETIWLRWLRVLVGATAPAVSATLVAFFAGHLLGAAWAGARVAAWRRPLAAYGRLELAAGAAAAAVPLVLLAGERVLAPFYDALLEAPRTLLLARLGLALAAALPAAFCFGATFPAIGQAAAPLLWQLGARGAALYAANTLGAALGAALATFWLPGAVGVRATYALALSALAAAGFGALFLARKEAPPPLRQPTPSEEPASVTASGGDVRSEPKASEVNRRAAAQQPDRAEGPIARSEPKASEVNSSPACRQPERPKAAAQRPFGPVFGVALAALAGFCAFALQVLLVHTFGQVLNQSTHAFGAVLVVVLLAIAAASAAVAWSARRGVPDPRSVLGAAAAAAALATAVFPAWLARITGGLQYVGAEAPGLPYLTAAITTVALAAGPALLAGSCVFPLTLVLAGCAPARAGAGARIGRLVAANTAGAIAGALAAPWLLLPRLGPWVAFVAVAAPWGAAALALPDATRRRRLARCLALAIGAAAIGLGADPRDLPVARGTPGERLLAAEVTPAGVVAVVEHGGERLIRVDGHYALGGTAERVHHERQAHLPLLLAPDARRVAHVGSATGISAGAALAHPIESLTVVEWIPAVARAGARFFAEANRGVYGDTRTRVVLDDARNFLRATHARFDVVVADLFVPWHAGAGSLYTLEHFAAVRARIEPAGLFCQWLPLYQLSEAELRMIAATFLDVFPRAALFRGDFYGRFPIAALVGWAGEPPAPAAVSAAAEGLARAGERDRWVTDPAGPWALYVGALAPLASALAGVPRNRDDHPWVEERAAGSHAGGQRGKVDPLVGLAWVGFSETVRGAARAAGDPLFSSLPRESARAVEGGALLQQAGALYAAGRIDAAAQTFAAAAQLLPERLVAAAPADPSAAELWSDEEARR